jgi:hypothetical protein
MRAARVKSGRVRRNAVVIVVAGPLGRVAIVVRVRMANAGSGNRARIVLHVPRAIGPQVIVRRGSRAKIAAPAQMANAGNGNHVVTVPRAVIVRFRNVTATNRIRSAKAQVLAAALALARASHGSGATAAGSVANRATTGAAAASAVTVAPRAAATMAQPRVRAASHLVTGIPATPDARFVCLFEKPPAQPNGCAGFFVLAGC